MNFHVLCMNPAIDKQYFIDDFAADGVYTGMAPKVYAGGKGVNVARVLSQLGERPRFYALLGETGGELIRAEMSLRCESVFLPVSGACRVTTNILDRKNGRETVISEQGPRAETRDVRAMLAVLKEAVVPGDLLVCSGSVMAGVPLDFYAQVSALCAEVGADCALDCNAKTLPHALTGAHYALGKPNEAELCTLLGKPRTRDPRRIAELAVRIMPPFERLLVSLGSQGGVLVTRDGALRANMPEISVEATVGSGDACFAGALYAMKRGADAGEILRTAMACGAVNAALGGNGSVDAGAVGVLRGKIGIEAV